jgi:anti-sigma-K factor RskA
VPVTGESASTFDSIDNVERFERRVRAAIAANVDLMDGPPRVVERAMSATRHAQWRRRQRWRAAAVAAAAGLVLAAVATGWRPGG